MKYSYLLLLLCTSIWAQAPQQQLSLQQAIDYGLLNNYNSTNAQRDIAAAEKQKWETTAIGLPQLNAKVDYQHFIKQPVSLIPAEVFGGKKGEFAEVNFGTKQNVNASATLSQLLFDGSYLVGLQSAKVFLEISKNAKEKTDLEVRKAIILAYTNVLVAQKNQEILENNLKNISKTLKETEQIYNNGLTELENVEQLQITKGTIANNLNHVTRLKDIAMDMLKFSLGAPLASNITLTDTLDTLSQDAIAGAITNTKYALENTIDYKIAANNTKAKSLLFKLEKTKALPSLSAFLNAGYAANSNSFTFLETDQKWFGSALVGVGLQLPIFSSGKRSAATKRAKINLEKAKTDFIKTQERITLAIKKAKSDYTFAIEELKTAQQNLDLAQRIEKKNQTKFFEGIISSFTLRQAQLQLYSSQQAYINAMLAVVEQKTNVETITNSF